MCQIEMRFVNIGWRKARRGESTSLFQIMERERAARHCWLHRKWQVRMDLVEISSKHSATGVMRPQRLRSPGSRTRKWGEEGVLLILKVQCWSSRWRTLLHLKRRSSMGKVLWQVLARLVNKNGRGVTCNESIIVCYLFIFLQFYQGWI